MARIFRKTSGRTLGFKKGAGIFMRVDSRKLIGKLTSIMSDNKNHLMIATRKCVLIVEAEAKRLIRDGYYQPAIDTGRLINSIEGIVVYATGTKALGRIGTNVYYAIYVHEGTINMEARPFLVDAVKNKEREIKKIYLDAVERSFAANRR